MFVLVFSQQAQRLKQTSCHNQCNGIRVRPLIPWQRAFLFAVDTVSASFESAAVRQEEGKRNQKKEEKKREKKNSWDPDVGGPMIPY